MRGRVCTCILNFGIYALTEVDVSNKTINYYLLEVFFLSNYFSGNNQRDVLIKTFGIKFQKVPDLG